MPMSHGSSSCSVPVQKLKSGLSASGSPGTDLAVLVGFHQCKIITEANKNTSFPKAEALSRIFSPVCCSLNHGN